MLYAKVNGKKIETYPITETQIKRELQALNISVPRSLKDFDTRPWGYFPVPEKKPPTSTKATHRYVLDIPQWNGDTLERTFKEVKIPQTEIDKQLKAIRKKRDLLLRQTDWTQLLDTNLDASSKALYKDYRVKLRDITKSKDIFNVEWPSLPGS